MRTHCFCIAGLLLLMTLHSCEKSSDWEITPAHGDRLVVEAILVNKNMTQEIRLSRTYDALNQEIPAVTDAEVTVQAGNIVYPFAPAAEVPGLYRSTQPFTVVGQLPYSMTIAWQGKTYIATSVLSDVAPLTPLRFISADTLGNFTVPDDVVPLFNEAQDAMYQIDLDWSQVTQSEEDIARLYYYTFSSIHISEFLQPAHEDIIFPPGTTAHITKYGLNPDFAAYLRSVLIETTWNGNYFFGNPENQPGNISGGAVGFFTTCAIQEQTVIVQ